MSPRATFLLTLAGVILVGIPLPRLTGKNDTVPVEIKAEEDVFQIWFENERIRSYDEVPTMGTD